MSAVELSDLERKSLYLAFLACQKEEEIKAFLADLLTPEEIETFEDRWSIAQSYMGTNSSKIDMRKYHNVSNDLISRVCKEIKQKRNQGYTLVYEILFKKPPVVRAD